MHGDQAAQALRLGIERVQPSVSEEAKADGREKGATEPSSVMVRRSSLIDSSTSRNGMRATARKRGLTLVEGHPEFSWSVAELKVVGHD